MVNIYALINPLNAQVFYIGATINTRQRLADHCSYLDETDKAKVICSILENDKKPELLVLETVSYEMASFFEEFYADLFRSFGFRIRKTKSNYKGNILSRYQQKQLKKNN